MLPRALLFLLLVTAAAAARPSTNFGPEIEAHVAQQRLRDALGDARLYPVGEPRYATFVGARLRALHLAYVLDLHAAGLPTRADGSGYHPVLWRCVAIGIDFVAYAQRELYRQTWRQPGQAARPAAWVAIYRPKGDYRRPQAHAVVLLLTESGWVFWDPQVGQVELSLAERQTIRLLID